MEEGIEETAMLQANVFFHQAEEADVGKRLMSPSIKVETWAA